ncbi:MAG: DUF3592 domain-containing protein [Anaerolineae bacterium]|nr:DUF3592 domain-containing protein [Candidatus Roseilinea sp.]MDW8448707.1 DUF3592 domain-containing protein [Anaerolineae bacterium]
MDPVRLIVAMPLIVVGCLLAAAGVVLLRRSLAYTATATIHAANAPQGEDASSRPPALLRFTTRDGRPVEVPLPRASEHEVGEQVTVIYDPTYPEIAQIASPLRLWIAPGVMALAGAAIAIAGAANLAAAVR